MQVVIGFVPLITITTTTHFVVHCNNDQSRMWLYMKLRAIGRLLVRRANSILEL